MNTNHNCKNTCLIDIHNVDITILKRTFAFVAIIVLSFVSAYGQNTTIILNADSNGKSTYVECGTTYYFYDSGGASGKYLNNEDYTYTFESCNPVTITITEFGGDFSSDKLYIYDGNLSTCIATIKGYGFTSSSPETYTATSGKMIINWVSDVSSTYSGWISEITCSGSNVCATHTLTYNTSDNCSAESSSAPASVTASGTVITNNIPSCSSVSTPVFLGWNTSQGGSGLNYMAGENISLLNNDVTLYAQYGECKVETINDGTNTGGEYAPFYSYNTHYSYTQQLYLKDNICSDCDENKMIKKVYFKYYGTATQSMTFDLYMANTTKTDLSSGWVNTGLQLVANDKTISFTRESWIEIVLDGDGFVWDHTKNLVIAMHTSTKPQYSYDRKFYYTTNSNMVRVASLSTHEIYLNSSTHIPDGNGGSYDSGNIQNTLPLLKLCMAPYCEPPTFLFTTAAAERALGSSYDLTAIFTLNNPTGRPVTYSCDPAKATISGTTITPLVGGDITITAHIDAYNGKCSADATATLTVTCNDSQFEFNQYGVFCTIGNTVSAPSYTKTSPSTIITYTSDDEAIATVNPSTGVVTGVSEGYTTITAHLAASGNFCQKTATFVAYVSPDESCMPFTAGNCNLHSAYAPFYSMSYYSFSYVQMLYTASELRAAGLSAGKINKIAFHYYGRPSSPHNFSQKFRVFIAQTTSTSLSSSWATPTTSFVEKFSGEKSFTQDSWTYIELTDGFNWDGTSNIVIAVSTYENYPEEEVDPNRRFCNSNSEQYVRYVAKQPSELGGATEIPLNANKIPSEPGSSSLYHADIKFCQDASTIVLPIELADFKANCKGNKIDVSWETASERNNEAFILEHSSNAVDFTEIARISGAGNSIETLRYTYTDDKPNQGDNYYRLQQVDSDGTYSYSEIIVAKCNTMDIGKLNVDAYPNPFSNELTIALSNFDGQRTNIDVFDMLGKTIATRTIENPGNYYETTLNLDGFPKAAYNVRISANGATINKLVVKN